MASAGASDHAAACGSEAHARRLLRLLREDDLDAAIDAGLVDYTAHRALDDADNALILAARDRLLAAWAARERHRLRGARLLRRAAERDARRTAPRDDATGKATALPPAAAAALARARARAAGKA